LNKQIFQIIWSFNRACQLDLLLRSQYKYATGIHRTTVLYRADGEKHVEAYKKLVLVYDNIVSFVEEKDFKQDITRILDESDAKYILGNSDDNAWVDYVDVNGITPDHGEVAISLRLNPRINYCQPASSPAIRGSEIKQFPNGALGIDWMDDESTWCWAYPHPCDSHIYLKWYFEKILRGGDFHNPRTMELHMDSKRREAPPVIGFRKHSKLLSIANNCIQDGSSNPAGDASPNTLCDKYLSGQRISLGCLPSPKATSCHVVTPYSFLNKK